MSTKARMEKDLSQLEQEIATFTISEFQDILRTKLEIRDLRSLFVWGPPGVGKTSVVEAVAKEYGILCSVKRLAQENPVTAVGLPYPDPETNRTIRFPAHYLSKIIEADKRGEMSILFLDEILEATPETISSLWEIINEKQLNGYQFKNLLVIAASNPDLRKIRKFNEAFWNRWFHMVIRYDVSDFLNYIKDKYPNSNVYRFLSQFPERMVVYSEVFGYSFTPREWEEIARVEEKLVSSGKTVSDAYYKVLLREQLYLEYIAFVRFDGKLYHPKEYLKNPTLLSENKEESLLGSYQEVVVKRLGENILYIIYYLTNQDHMSMPQVVRNYVKLIDVALPNTKIYLLNVLSEMREKFAKIVINDEEDEIFSFLKKNSKDDALESLSSWAKNLSPKVASDILKEFLVELGELINNLDEEVDLDISSDTCELLKKWRSREI